MKTTLLASTLAVGLALTGFAQEAKKGECPDQKAPAQKCSCSCCRKQAPPAAPRKFAKGFHNRGELAAKMEFPQEWAALEKQRAELIAKAQEKAKAFRDAVRKYRENKDQASLKLIRETLGKRYDSIIDSLKRRVEKMEKEQNQMAGKMKEALTRMTSEGKEKWIEKQIQRLSNPRKAGPRHRGIKPAAK